MSAIENSKKQPLNRLIYGLGIRYVGETTAKTLAKSVDTVFDLKKFSLEDLMQLKDIGGKVAESVFSFFHNEDNIKILEELADKGVNINGDKAAPVSGKLSGFTFLF